MISNKYYILLAFFCPRNWKVLGFFRIFLTWRAQFRHSSCCYQGVVFKWSEIEKSKCTPGDPKMTFLFKFGDKIYISPVYEIMLTGLMFFLMFCRIYDFIPLTLFRCRRHRFTSDNCSLFASSTAPRTNYFVLTGSRSFLTRLIFFGHLDSPPFQVKLFPLFLFQVQRKKPGPKGLNAPQINRHRLECARL